jgi:hypothetical protein
MVQVGEGRGVARAIDSAMVDSLRPYNMNLPGPNNQCLPSMLHTGI